MKKIGLVLVDDWELRGNGSGSVLEFQRKPALKLMDAYESCGVKGSFTVEVLQQLAFEKFAPDYPEIKSEAEWWKDTVREFISRGHDAQLHLHIQWHEARYRDGVWELSKVWSIAQYPAEAVDPAVKAGKDYLIDLIRPLKPEHRIQVFRAGGWAMQPSRVILEALSREGIEIDISVNLGFYCREPKLPVDYRRLEEPDFPYYPDFDDITRVAGEPAPLLEVPTQTLIPKLPFWQEWAAQLQGKSRRAPFNLSGLTLEQMKAGIKPILEKFLASPLEFVPLVLENHTKDQNNFEEVRRFIDFVQRTWGENAEFITLTQMRDKIAQNPQKLVRSKHE